MNCVPAPDGAAREAQPRRMEKSRPRFVEAGADMHMEKRIPFCEQLQKTIHMSRESCAVYCLTFARLSYFPVDNFDEMRYNKKYLLYRAN